MEKNVYRLGKNMEITGDANIQMKLKYDFKVKTAKAIAIGIVIGFVINEIISYIPKAV